MLTMMMTMLTTLTMPVRQVNSFVGAFHDAVLLYALALNETLASNGSISDGAAITRRMWNRTFEGQSRVRGQGQGPGARAGSLRSDHPPVETVGFFFVLF